MKIFHLILLTLVTSAFGYLTAQTTQSEIETFLINDWIQNPISASIDQYASGKCESGKSYIFSSEGKLEIKECRNNRMRTSSQTWTLKQSEYGDWQLTVGTTLYSLEMTTKNGKESLVLVPTPQEFTEENTETIPESSPISLYRLAPGPEGEAPD